MALEEWGLPGLASSFQFLALNRGHVTTMINWIPELVARIIE
jgi:neurofibromin 1